MTSLFLCVSRLSLCDDRWKVNLIYSIHIQEPALLPTRLPDPRLASSATGDSGWKPNPSHRWSRSLAQPVRLMGMAAAGVFPISGGIVEISRVVPIISAPSGADLQQWEPGMVRREMNGLPHDNLDKRTRSLTYCILIDWPTWKDKKYKTKE
jgi:hypothetical protein